MGHKKWTERRRPVSRMNQRKRGSQRKRVEKERQERDRERTLRRDRAACDHLERGRVRTWHELRKPEGEPRVSRLEALMLALAAADREVAWQCAVKCVRTVVPRADHWDQGLRADIDGLLAGSREVSRRAIERGSLRAATRLEESSFWYDLWSREHHYEAPDLGTAHALRAVARLCGCWRVEAAAETVAQAAVAHGVRLAAQQPAHSAAWRKTLAAGARAHLDRLFDQISALTWPRVMVTPEQLHAAPPVLAVAWDRFADAPAHQSASELVEAHARAGRLGLSWEDPLQRAIAERATDETWLVALLSRLER